MFAPPDMQDSGRPVVTLSLLVNYAAHGLNVWGYRALNIAVHLLAGLTLYGVVRRTLVSEVLVERFGRASGPIALTVALVWLVHPLQTECICYTSQRSESLMGLFYLLTLYCAIRAGTASRRWPWLVAAVSACTLGMASKEAMVTAPLAVVLCDWAFRARPFSQVIRRRWALYAALAGAWVVLAGLMATAPRAQSVGFGLGVSSLDYALSQCEMIITYLRLAIWPYPLALDYGEPQPRTIGELLPYVIGVVVLLAACAVAWWRWPRIGFAGVWFFLILGPTSSFVPIATEVGAERRMYLPLASVVVLAVMGAYELLQRLEQQRSAKQRTTRRETAAARVPRGLAMSLIGLTVIALGATTIVRNRDYRSGEAIWKTVIRARPENGRGHSGLANVLLKQGRPLDALPHYETALRLRPRHYETISNLGLALGRLNRYEEAVAQHQRAVEIKQDDPRLRARLALTFGRMGQLDESVREFEETLRQDPSLTEARVNFVATLMQLARVDEAIGHCRQVLREDQSHVLARANLGLLLMRHGAWDEAIEHLRFAAGQTGNPDLFFELGRAFEMAGRPGEALSQYQQVLRLAPGHDQAKQRLKALRGR